MRGNYSDKFEKIVEQIGVNSSIHIIGIFPFDKEVMVSLKNGNGVIYSVNDINPKRVASDLVARIKALPDYKIKFDPIKLYYSWTDGRTTKYPNRAIKSLDFIIEKKAYKNATA